MLTLVLLAVAGCGGGAHVEGAERYEIHSRYVGRDLEQVLIRPDDDSDVLLVLLHGRGSSPDTVLSYFDDAPFAIVAPSGGDHSYYHDRADGRWGTYVLREVIPEAVKRTGATQVAIGGISMGGFGALDLARQDPGRFCAVGGHSPALWRSGGETPAGAFDDAADFARHDVIGMAAAGTFVDDVWLDVGKDDPFHDATVYLAERLRARGRRVRLHVWPGGHEGDYWREHGPQYARFYASRC